MITITKQASNHLSSVSKGQNNVEFSIDSGGCSGMNYNLKFTNRKPNERDHVINFANDSMKLLVPFNSYVYLMNTEIDWSADLLNGGFKFGNPQANRTCGCGTSFSVQYNEYNNIKKQLIKYWI